MISQFLMAIRLMALYEISILIAKLAGRKKKATQEAEVIEHYSLDIEH